MVMPVQSYAFCGHGNKDVDAFFQMLASGLERLEEALEQDYVRREWLQQALDLLRRVHSEVLALVDKLKLPLAAKGSGDEWVDSYMEETVKLLEVCNVLKAGMAGLEQYHMLVEVGVRALDSGVAVLKSQCCRGLHALNVCQDEVARLTGDHRNLVETKIEADGKLLLSLNEKHVDHKSAKWGGFWGVMFAVKNVNAFLGRLLVWSLVYAGDKPPFFGAAVSLEALGCNSAWSAGLLRLHERLNREIDRKKSAKRTFFTFFYDFEQLQLRTLSLILRLQPLTRGPTVLAKHDSDNLKQATQQLKETSQGLHKGLDVLEWHVNDLFDDVVEGRNKLLNLLSNVLRS